MDLNFPVFATGVRIFRASNDVGPLFLGPGSTRILEIKFISSIRVDPGPRNSLFLVFVWTEDPEIEVLHRY